MRTLVRLLLALALAALLPALALADTRALLVACSDFVSQPNLGNATSGNLQMIGSALLGADPRLTGLSIEDGTIGTAQALDEAITRAFGAATEEDLSILYLCTHGILSSSDDAQAYLLLGDGETETPLSASSLYEMIAPIQGEKLLILDACFSGALIGRGAGAGIALPGAKSVERMLASPFLADPSIHVLTSADGHEAGWYYDSDQLATGAVSYFASALSSGLGLYGSVEADANGDGMLTLRELYGYLRVAVPSSSAQLLSSSADSLLLPAAQGAMLSRPLTGFSYGSSLLLASDPTLDFSFTVAQEAAVQYRLIEYADGGWDWEGAQTFLDAGDAQTGDTRAGDDLPGNDGGAGTLTPGRKSRSLTLSGVTPQDSGYLMLQVFSVTGSELILCSERLIAVQSAQTGAQLALRAPHRLAQPGVSELALSVTLDTPAELTVSVFDSQGRLLRRLAQSALTRPAADDTTRLYWDGRDAQGELVPEGDYVLAAEALVGTQRQKATANVRVGG